MCLSKIIVDKEKYIRLLKNELELNHLNMGGVDNWEWYGDCFPDDYEDRLQKIDKLSFNEYKKE